MSKKKVMGLFLALALVGVFASIACAAPADEIARLATKGKVIDLRMTNDPNYPCFWGGSQTPPFMVWTNAYIDDPKVRPDRNVWYSNTLTFDEHLGTHFDAPSHFIPKQATGFSVADVVTSKIDPKWGEVDCDECLAEWFIGPAKVIDCTDLIGKADKGKSPLITVDFVKDWESRYGKIEPGDVVVFYTSYCPRYYKPFPAGNRMVYDVIEKGTAVGWPGPAPETAAYLADKGVKCLAGDIPSMGPWQVIRNTHVAGLGRGMVYVEQLMNLDKLPPTGAYFIFIPVKTAGVSGGPGGAIAIIP
ncbi:MAG: cyclase family protein [Deltaproteobacteria bacterium]|nr:MAG: cyclase family protein [Deltaproteobacteria bacterium]